MKYDTTLFGIEPDFLFDLLVDCFEIFFFSLLFLLLLNSNGPIAEVSLFQPLHLLMNRLGIVPGLFRDWFWLIIRFSAIL